MRKTPPAAPAFRMMELDSLDNAGATAASCAQREGTTAATLFVRGGLADWPAGTATLDTVRRQKRESAKCARSNAGLECTPR